MRTATFYGHLGRDAELRYTPGGQAVCNWSIGVNRGKDKGSFWVECALWGKRGEVMSEYLTKGSAVVVSGELDLETYETRDGIEKGKLVMNVQSITLANSKQDKAQQRDNNFKEQTRQQSQPRGVADLEDDIPF